MEPYQNQNQFLQQNPEFLSKIQDFINKNSLSAYKKQLKQAEKSLFILTNSLPQLQNSSSSESQQYSSNTDSESESQSSQKQIQQIPRIEEQNKSQTQTFKKSQQNLKTIEEQLQKEEQQYNHTNQQIKMYLNSLIKQQAIEGLYFQKDLLQEQDRKDLNNLIDQFRDEQEIKDYHPGSNGIVRDIIHQSLYLNQKLETQILPYSYTQFYDQHELEDEYEENTSQRGTEREIDEQSLSSNSTDQQEHSYQSWVDSEKRQTGNCSWAEVRHIVEKDEEGNFRHRKEMVPGSHIAEGGLWTRKRISYKFNLNQDFWGRKIKVSSLYKWIPTQVKIYRQYNATQEYSAQFQGYLNNLPEKYQNLKSQLQNLLSKMIPGFKHIIENYINNQNFNSWSDFEDYDIEHNINSDFYNFMIENRKKDLKLNFKNFLVIPKIVEYELKPGQHYNGVWHVEGLSNEFIIATGVYFPKMDPEIQGGILSFKRNLLQEEINDLQLNNNYEQAQLDTVFKYLGNLQTEQNQLVIFPNSHIHRMNEIVNKTMDNKTKYRRLIAFFVVHPAAKIANTNHIEPQQDKISYEKACEWRLESMKKRSTIKASLNQEEPPAEYEILEESESEHFNYCEH